MAMDVWTTRTHPVSARFEAWRDALSASHLDWRLDPPGERPFVARIRQRTLDGIRVVECRCDPCTGWRRRAELRRTDGAYFGILFELRGREVIRQGDREAILEAGDFVLWDSEREMEFRVVEPLHKLTLLIPKARARLLLGDAERYAGTVVTGSGKADGISAEALRRLARDFASIEEHEAEAVMEPLLSLLMATLTTRRQPMEASPAHRDSFSRFCRHIEENLGDCALTPSAVAEAHGVSLRYLHAIFAENGTSFGRFLRKERLRHCHRELALAGSRKTVTEVAFRWGFSDMAHFSRAFKAEFGLSPRDVLRR